MVKTTDVLVLQVTNSESIESGIVGHFVFDRNGGAIGSGENNHWIIQDRKGNVLPEQARIEIRDNHYCLQVLGKNSISINNAQVAAKSGFIRLNKGDVIIIGEIHIRTYIESEGTTDFTVSSLKPEEIIGNSKDPLADIIGNQQRYSSNYQSVVQTVNDTVTVDPLTALSEHNSLTKPLERNTKNAVIPSISTKSPKYENPSMNSSPYIDLPKANDQTQSEYIENAYVTISPLLREMDSQVPLQNSQDINDILAEVGKTIKALVLGLLDLQKEQNSLSDKHLRPIEDNPLRLNLDYATTIDILFGNQKSPVHLAAPAAVSESLNNLRIHNEANRTAIIAALTAILEAFSPTILLSRFENYRRSNDTQKADSAWAWEMYQNYYRELTSTRQQGFEKLFWEVYGQAYDKALRDSK